MGHKMTVLTLRFSSICVMACKIKVVQRGVNITQLKHQMTVGYHKNKASWKRVCVHSSWWIQKYLSLSHDVVFSKTTTRKPFDGQPPREHMWCTNHSYWNPANQLVTTRGDAYQVDIIARRRLHVAVCSRGVAIHNGSDKTMTNDITLINITKPLANL